MTSSAASDALLERATRGAAPCALSVRSYGTALQEARTEADLVERMQAIGRMILAAEQAAKQFAALVEDARSAMAETFLETGATGIDTGTHTISGTTKPGRVVITDRAAIPAEYIRTPPPEPDKEAIGKAIRKGESVPGATIAGNGAPSITISAKKAA